MSSRVPETVTSSFSELARHGGETGPHGDGWGLAYYRDGDVQRVREPKAAARSAWVRFVENQGPASDLVLSHVRKATQGALALRNTQPFSRELRGRMHVFAHNGDLAGIADHPRFRREGCDPIGETDSELAFCALLTRIRTLWTDGVPTVEARRAAVERFAADLRPLGPANFIYADGELLFAHGHRRTQDDGERRPPGLHVSERTCTCDGGASQRVVLFASVPLSDEGWRPFEDGELIVAQRGAIVSPAAIDRRAAASPP